MAFRLITRADDFGSCFSANAAILEALNADTMVRNVSCMAPGKQMQRDAWELKRYADRVDFGLHFTLNSEWDLVKWQPCAQKAEIPSLLDGTGNFYPTSQALQNAGIRLEEAMKELDAQLERLTALEIPISYVDGHMFPERAVPGLAGEMKAWADRKGLLCANDFFDLWLGSPAFAESTPAFLENVRQWLGNLPPEGLGLYVSHPAMYSLETLAFSNAAFPSGVVAHERELEYHSAVSARWEPWTRILGIDLIRFRDAKLPKGHQKEG